MPPTPTPKKDDQPNEKIPDEADTNDDRDDDAPPTREDNDTREAWRGTP